MSSTEPTTADLPRDCPRTAARNNRRLAELTLPLAGRASSPTDRRNSKQPHGADGACGKVDGKSRRR
ncbi:MAG: hypothetical protein E7042_06955 [Lentisphaerae bacterium]|nr:hypothetical protein [Lentisphaerota bacterium]